MRRLLLTAGAALALCAPAFAQSTVTIEKKTITKDITSDLPESGSTVSTVVIAPNAPPPPQVETPPPPPGAAVVWTPGRWGWDPEALNYVWVSGRYVEPPRARAAWAPGHWRQEPRGWVWVEGHWN